MANVINVGTNYPRRINMYVPAMAYSSDVNYNGVTRVSFGAPLAAVANSILNAVSIAAGTQVDLSGVVAVADPFGRNVVVVAGAANSTAVVVYGYDYLNQPIAESLTLNGTTPVVGNKCFKSFSYMTYTAAATTITLGTGVKLGLPYKAIRVEYEVGNGVVAAAGTLQAPSLVDPQTNTTLDPRGAYTTTTTMNGTNIISAVFDMANDVNTANRGGLMGLAQAAA
jgi:hypothetical protein